MDRPWRGGADWRRAASGELEQSTAAYDGQRLSRP